MSTKLFFFYLFSILAILGSLWVVLKKNPISSAFSLILVFFSFSGLYALLEAHLIAALQLLVYAGGIVVLFLFVIMLLQADKPSTDFPSIHKAWLLLSGCSALSLLSLLLFHFDKTVFPHSLGHWSLDQIEQKGGNTLVLSEALFSEAILPFEATSLLLLVAVIGSVTMSKRHPSVQKKK